jgi:hypothetical protein
MPNIYQEGKSQFGPLPGAQGSLWAVGDAKGNPVRSSSGQTCGVVWFGLVWFGLVMRAAVSECCVVDQQRSLRATSVQNGQG